MLDQMDIWVQTTAIDVSVLTYTVLVAAVLHMKLGFLNL